MKKLKLLSFLLIISTILKADCGPILSFFPFRKTIKQNAIFMVESSNHGYWGLLDSFNIKYPIYLKSGNDSVKLVVFEKKKGQKGLIQVLLKPTELLKAGKVYEIIIGNYPANEFWGDNKVRPLKKWKVKRGKDEIAPIFKETPKVMGRVAIEFGCGDVVIVNFKIKVKDKSEHLVKTTVLDLKTGKSSDYYYLTSKKNVVDVGEYMCEGAFYLTYKGDYQATFSLIDACGNENLTDIKVIQFKGPGHYSE